MAQVTGGEAQIQVEFTKDSLEIVKQNVAAGAAVLVDVRSEEEWNEGFIEGAIFLPITSLCSGSDPEAIAKALPKKILYTYCRVGMRALLAAVALERQGHTVRALRPGYDDLVMAEFKKAAPRVEKKD